MPTFEQKLDQFAQGKRLMRLPRPVRDRADALCDACGSSQPRTLYALQDLDSGRYFFLGDTCLKETVSRGAVLRRYGKESGQSAFKSEMERRAAEPGQEQGSSLATAEPSNDRSDPVEGGPPTHANLLTGAPSIFPVVLIVESPELYRVMISLVSDHGVLHGWGRAEEPRYQATWKIAPGNGRVIEKVKEECPDALDSCVARAWQQALAGHQGPALLENAETDGKLDTGMGDRSGLVFAQLQTAAVAMGQVPGRNGTTGQLPRES